VRESPLVNLGTLLNAWMTLLSFSLVKQVVGGDKGFWDNTFEAS
jgi:hypothetical protein